MKRKKLPVWTVRWSRAKAWWVLRDHRGGRVGAPRFHRAILLEELRGRVGNETCSVRIYGKNGRVQEERTYPRSADHRRSRG